MSADAASANSFRIWWPMGLCGLLMPFATLLLHRWMPLWVATFVAFTILFAAAGLLVQRRLPATDRKYSWVVSGALLGGAVGAVLAYFLPWA